MSSCSGGDRRWHGRHGGHDTITADCAVLSATIFIRCRGAAPSCAGLFVLDKHPPPVGCRLFQVHDGTDREHRRCCKFTHRVRNTVQISRRNDRWVRRPSTASASDQMKWSGAPTPSMHADRPISPTDAGSSFRWWLTYSSRSGAFVGSDISVESPL